jgi:transposase
LRVTRNGRRYFGQAYKREIVEKCLAPGASVSGVALAHGFNTNLVRKWIDKHKSGQGQSGASSALVPVKVIAAPRKSTRKAARAAGARACEIAGGWIEIELGTARLIVRGKVEASQLRAALEALGVWR